MGGEEKTKKLYMTVTHRSFSTWKTQDKGKGQCRMSEGQLMKDAWEEGTNKQQGSGNLSRYRVTLKGPGRRACGEHEGLRDTARHLQDTLRKGGGPRTARTRVS